MPLDASTYGTKQSFSLLLIGEPFSGKTTLACSFPNPGIIDADGKFGNAYAHHHSRNPDFKFKVWTCDNDDTGKVIPPELRWPRFLQCCNEAATDPWVKTIIPDSATKISQYLQDFIVAQPSATKDLTVGGTKMMTQNHWYPFQILLQRTIAGLNACGKNVIMPVHIRTDKDEVSGTLIYRPSVPGSTGESMGKMFNNFWLCQAKPCQPDAKYPRGVKYVVTTSPTSRLSLGSAIPSLPPEFEFSWDSFKALVPWLPQ